MQCNSLCINLSFRWPLLIFWRDNTWKKLYNYDRVGEVDYSQSSTNDTQLYLQSQEEEAKRTARPRPEDSHCECSTRSTSADDSEVKVFLPDRNFIEHHDLDRIASFQMIMYLPKDTSVLKVHMGCSYLYGIAANEITHK